MNTKYGELPDESLIAYLNWVTSQVFKMLPMKEEESDTLELHMKAILRELIGNKELVDLLKNNRQFLSILGTLESMITQEDFTTFRSDIFKITNTITKIKQSIGGDIK